MSKEEFIKLLETLDFEEIRCATVSYYKKKPKKNLSYWEESNDYNPKTICIGTNLESLINEQHTYTSNLFEEAMRRISDLEGVKNNEIREKIFKLEAELEETEMNETIREEARKAAEALKSIRDEMIKAGLPEELVDKLLLRSITINRGE